jgi:hypothetical protein
VPLDLGPLTDRVGTQPETTELRAKLKGKYADQLATLERLLDTADTT